MDINAAIKSINKKAEKVKTASNKITEPGFGWEIGAYAVRGVSVIAPSTIIMCMQNSWLKTGLGLFATLVIVALFIIYRKPITAAMGYAPGVIPFAIFIAVALFFNTAAKSLLTIGISGLSGSILAIPLHLKYVLCAKQAKSPELIAVEAIAERLK